jgi:Fe-S oxidoreductase
MKRIEDFNIYTQKCFNGEPASCSCACPFSLDVRSFVEKCEKGRWAAAWKAYRNAVVFPSVAAALCPAPCKNHCQREIYGGAIDLPALEKTVNKYAKNKSAEAYNIPPKSESVAVVGAGAAGLSCALNLAHKKYKVTVFDKKEGWGGRLREHPLFSDFNEDFILQFTAADVDFRFSTEITDAGELDGFNAVYMATGRGGFTLTGEKFFHGGELTGKSLMEGIAMGGEASKAIETYLQTGRKVDIFDISSTANCDRYVRHKGAEVIAPVVNPDGYSEDEAKAEAARCFKCDCTDCISDCEMLTKYRKKPHALSREAYADSQAAPPIATQSLVRQTYACLNCGHCKSICPEKVDIGALMMFSRADRFSSGHGPMAFHDYWLREMDFATSEASLSKAPKGKETCSYAFFPGCRLGMDSPGSVRAAYEFLSVYTKGETGLMLGCCGAPALWAGDEIRLNDNYTVIRSSWELLGRPTLVFACATCENMFERYLPDIPRVSVYELMDKAGLRPAETVSGINTVFDPCSAREDSAMRLSVRVLSERADAELEEIEDGCRCCGYGGHIQVPDPQLFEQISSNRAAVSDKPYIVYCANCREVFAARGKECRHILDIYFGEGNTGVPSLLDKWNNALNLKKELLKEKWDMDFTPEAKPWDGIILNISPELQKKLDRCLISAADLKEAVYQAEGSGDKLVNEDGQSLASMVKPAVVYWVQYIKNGDAYEVITAYSHRIKWRV